MKIYTVAVNGISRKVRASRASVAVHRALDHFTDSQVVGAAITVWFVASIKFGYRYLADVPCLPTGSTKRELVGPVYATDQAARIALKDFQTEHPEYGRVSIGRVEL